MNDEVIEELWRVKDAIAKEHNYDIHLLSERIRNRERLADEQVVDLGKTSKARI